MDDFYDKRALERLDKLEVKQTELERAITENTQLTKTIAENTGEIVELVKGWRTVKNIRDFSLWIAPFIALIVAAIAYIKGAK